MESAFALLLNLAAHSAIFAFLVLRRRRWLVAARLLLVALRRTPNLFAGVVLGLFVTPQLRTAGSRACSYKVLAARLSPTSLDESSRNLGLAQTACQFQNLF